MNTTILAIVIAVVELVVGFIIIAAIVIYIGNRGFDYRLSGLLYKHRGTRLERFLRSIYVVKEVTIRGIYAPFYSRFLYTRINPKVKIGRRVTICAGTELIGVASYYNAPFTNAVETFVEKPDTELHNFVIAELKSGGSILLNIDPH